MGRHEGRDGGEVSLHAVIGHAPIIGHSPKAVLNESATTSPAGAAGGSEATIRLGTVAGNGAEAD